MKNNPFYIGYSTLAGFADLIDPALPVFAQTRMDVAQGTAGQGYHMLVVFISQVREGVGHYFLTPLKVYTTYMNEPIGEGLGNWRMDYNMLLTEAWEVLKGWWDEKGLPELVEGALTLPNNYTPIAGDAEIMLHVEAQGGPGHIVRMNPRMPLPVIPQFATDDPAKLAALQNLTETPPFVGGIMDGPNEMAG